MAKSIVINGVNYQSFDEVPPDVRERFQEMLSKFADKDLNGIPDIFEVDELNTFVFSSDSRIIINDNEYTGFEQLPTFVRKAFEEVLEDECYCVGWWHSHPGYGLFLSQTDINTHIFSFQLHNELSVALVVDPTKIDTNGRAAYKFYQVVGEEEKNPFEYKEIASYIQY